MKKPEAFINGKYITRWINWGSTREPGGLYKSIKTIPARRINTIKQELENLDNHIAKLAEQHQALREELALAIDSVGNVSWYKVEGEWESDHNGSINIVEGYVLASSSEAALYIAGQYEHYVSWTKATLVE